MRKNRTRFCYTSLSLAALLSLCTCLRATESPFSIDFPIQETLSPEDYHVLERQLAEIDLHPRLEPLWREFGAQPHFDYNRYYGRCSRGLHQAFFDPVTGRGPEKRVILLNGGGNDCMVSSVPYAKDYPGFQDDQIEALRKLGFRGVYISYRGAIPTPTGEEPRLAGVPYAWKIFAIRDAFKSGFRRVIWLDAALFPLKNPGPLFEEIEQHGFVTHSVDSTHWKWGCETKPVAAERGWIRHLFPETRRELHRLTGVDVLQERHFIAACFGLRADHPYTQPFLDGFYQMARLGTPFLSELPEEFVISALLGQPCFHEWKEQLARQSNAYKFFLDVVRADPEEAWIKARQMGCFFFWRQHRHPDLQKEPRPKKNRRIHHRLSPP